MDFRLNKHAFARRLAGYIYASRSDTEEMMRLARSREPLLLEKPPAYSYLDIL